MTVMIKNILRILFVGTIIVSLLGCKKVETNEKEGNNTTSLAASIMNTEGHNDMVKATLEINGTVVESQYTYIDSQSNNSHFSLTAALKAMGAEIVHGNSEISITFEGNTVTINTEEPLWGIPIPPGVTNSTREIIDNELIIDSNSIQGFFKKIMKAKIEVDYDAAIVSIKTD